MFDLRMSLVTFLRLSFYSLCLACVPISGAESGRGSFLLADRARRFEFPQDHGSHPEFKTEWWYLTGSLQSSAGEVFGFQATWFRTALFAERMQRRSRLATRDLIVFHGSLTDLAKQRFFHEEKSCRAASNWAGATEGNLRVWLLQDALTALPDGRWQLRFSVEGRRFDLLLEQTREVLLHGAQPGLSLKGAPLGQASYYASCTRLRTTGTLQREAGDVPISVQGLTWFDQEFGSNQLGEAQVGWDWFSVALEDGTDLMLYVIRLEDGRLEPASSGTLRFKDGRCAHLPLQDFSCEALTHWVSPKSGARYPAGWRLRVARYELDLEVRPLLADQELQGQGATATTYWEGLCAFNGRVQGQTTQGQGYVELVGYAQRFKHKL